MTFAFNLRRVIAHADGEDTDAVSRIHIDIGATGMNVYSIASRQCTK